jgi:hypothetical protein
MKLTEDDFNEAALLIGIRVSQVKGFTDIESKGSGFLKSGKVKILFEPYVFGRRTQHRFNGATVIIDGEVYPISLAGDWDSKKCKYGLESIQHRKREYAAQLDATAANESCSWGMFQTMGFNANACGFKDVFDMVQAYSKGAKEQLKGFCNFLKNSGVADALKKNNIDLASELYNGKGYKKHGYHIRLRAAIMKYEANSNYQLSVEPMGLEQIKKVSL